MTKIEILDFIVDYYKTHPRALKPSGTGCTYFNEENGARCAHSICIEDSVLEAMVSRAGGSNIESFSLGSSAYTIIKIFGDGIHKPEFRGHSVNFWADVQGLHDKSDNWTPNGVGSDLNGSGVERLSILKERYKNN